MSALGVVEDFVQATKTLTTTADLRSCVADAVSELGFLYFAVVHHVDFAQSPPGAVRVSNYPQSFYDAMVQKKYFADDPVLAASLRTARGFRWDEVGSFVSLTDRQKDIVALGAREGFGAGYTLPVNVPGEYAGSCSFVMKVGRTLVENRLPLLPYLGRLAFESGRRISLQAGPRAEFESLRLTDRQLDCLVLAARGLSARQAALTLGIAQHTVQQHLDAARARAGVRSTKQLVIRCLFEGQLTFRDLLPGRRRRGP